MRIHASPAVVSDYTKMFVNREAYTVQSSRPHPESGRYYYYRPTEKATKRALRLTRETLRQHLEGEITIALYAVNPATQCSKWVAIDADYKQALDDLLKVQYDLERQKIYAALEKSRRGGHLWIFFEDPQPARDCRMLIHDVASRLSVPVKGNGAVDGIEVFPRQDYVPAGEFGNAIRGPLGIHQGAGERFWFYGANYDLESQMSYLRRLPKVSGAQVKRLVADQLTAMEAAEREARAKGEQPKRSHSGGREFQILEHLSTKLRKVGRNYVTQCPSCAAAGHDRAGDNLAVRIEDPRFYLCWAGCTKEMIREALGCPIRYRQSA
ncbi:MAG: TOTE conflict system archaeo-eukaryotic primase domain-containing protein [Terriglobia bacterium]